MRKTSDQSRWKTSLGIVLLTSLAATPALAEAQSSKDAQAEAARISANMQIEPDAHLNAAENRALSLAAGRVLVHVDKARQDIDKKEKEKALGQISKALTLVRVVENAVPEYEVRATIKSGDLVYQDQDKVKMTMVPIFSELDQVSVRQEISGLTQTIEKDQASAVEKIDHWWDQLAHWQG